MRGNIFKKYCGVLQSCHWFLARDIIMRLCKECEIPTNSKLLPRLGLSLCFREAVGWWESSWIQLFPTTWPFFQLVGSGYSELYLFSRFSVWTFGIQWSFILCLFTSLVCVLTYVCMLLFFISAVTPFIKFIYLSYLPLFLSILHLRWYKLYTMRKSS